MEQSSAYERMMATARQWLAGKDPVRIAAASGADFDPERGEFRILSLGREVCIRYPDYSFSSEVSEWHQISLLHYLNLADGSIPRGEWISLSQMNSGMVRGGGFEKKFEALVRSKLGNLPPRAVEEACRRLGMRLEESNADLCARWDLAPHFPVMIKLWFADPEDDLPGSGRMFVDRTADCYLTIEDTVLVCEYLILDRLTEELGL